MLYDIPIYSSLYPFINSTFFKGMYFIVRGRHSPLSPKCVSMQIIHQNSITYRLFMGGVVPALFLRSKNASLFTCSGGISGSTDSTPLFNFLLMGWVTFSNRPPFLDGRKVATRKLVEEYLLVVTALALSINLHMLDMKAKMFLKMAWDQIHPE